MPPRLNRATTAFHAGIAAVVLAALLPQIIRGSGTEVPVFVRTIGSPGRLGTFNSPYGVAYVPTEGGDRIYVVDAGNARVQVLSSSGEAIGTFGHRGDAPEGMWAPTGLAASPTGEFIFVVDRLHRIVQKYRPTARCLEVGTGCFAGWWGGFGTGPALFTEPTGIAVDQRGRIYVADSGAHVVQVFDESGSYIDTMGEAGTERGQLMHPTDVAIADDGSVWVADRDNDRISVFDANYDFVTAHAFGDRLHYPVGVDFGSDGTFAIADYEEGYGRSRIRLFSAERKVLVEEILGGDGRKADYPLMGVAVLPDRAALSTAATCLESGVAEVAPTGAIKWLGERGRGLDQFVFPWAVAVDPLLLAVVDSGNDRVIVMEGPDGQRVHNVLGGELSPQFEFADPRGIAVWRTGPKIDDAVLLIADPQANVIFRGTPDGRRLDSWGTGAATDALDGFRQPLDVAVGPDGVAYIADTGNDRIVRRGPDGEVLGTIGPFETGPLELIRPSAVTVGPDGLVYVLESNRSRLQVFRPTGEQVGAWPGADLRDVEVGHLWLPVDLAYDGDYLYVLENESIQQGCGDHVRVQVFHVEPGRPLEESVVAVFAGTQGAGDGELWNPRGLAAVNGWIAAADSGNNRVQLFRWMEEGIEPPPILPTGTPPPSPTPTATDVPAPAATNTTAPSPTEAAPPTPTARPTDVPVTPTTAAPTAVPTRQTDPPVVDPTGVPTGASPGPSPTVPTPFVDRQPLPPDRVNYLPYAGH